MLIFFAPLFGIAIWIASTFFPCRGDTWVALHAAELTLLLWIFPYFGHKHPSVLSSTLFLGYQIICFCLVSALYRLSPWHPLAGFPGHWSHRVSSWPSVFRVARGHAHEELIELHSQYGDFVRTGPETLSINNHAAVETVYAASQAWDKSKNYRLGRMRGIGMFFMQDRTRALVSYEPLIDNLSNAFAVTLQERAGRANGVAEMSQVIQHWSHDLSDKWIFGSTSKANFLADGDPQGMVEASQTAGNVFEILGQSPALFDVLWYLPTTRAVRVVTSYMKQQLAERRSAGSNTEDLMHYYFSKSQQAIPERFRVGDDDLVLEVSAGSAAATSTTSAMLTIGFYHILANSSIQQRLVAELNDAFPNHDGLAPTSTNVLAKLPYLSAVVEETARIAGIFGMFPRTAPPGGAVVAGRYVPEGSIVSILAWGQNISEKNFYPSPRSFVPERWLPGEWAPGARTNRHAVTSFSHGPWGCLGKQLAIHQMQIMIAKTFLWHPLLQLADDFDHTAFTEGITHARTTHFAVPLRVRVPGA